MKQGDPTQGGMKEEPSPEELPRGSGPSYHRRTLSTRNLIAKTLKGGGSQRGTASTIVRPSLSLVSSSSGKVPPFPPSTFYSQKEEKTTESESEEVEIECSDPEDRSEESFVSSSSVSPHSSTAESSSLLRRFSLSNHSSSPLNSSNSAGAPLRSTASLPSSFLPSSYSSVAGSSRLGHVSAHRSQRSGSSSSSRSGSVVATYSAPFDRSAIRECSSTTDFASSRRHILPLSVRPLLLAHLPSFPLLQSGGKYQQQGHF